MDPLVKSIFDAETTFMHFDPDVSGEIDGREFEKMIVSLGMPMSLKEIGATFVALDNGDGKLSMAEFTDWFTSSGNGAKKQSAYTRAKLRAIHAKLK